MYGPEFTASNDFAPAADNSGQHQRLNKKRFSDIRKNGYHWKRKRLPSPALKITPLKPWRWRSLPR